EGNKLEPCPIGVKRVPFLAKRRPGFSLCLAEARYIAGRILQGFPEPSLGVVRWFVKLQYIALHRDRESGCLRGFSVSPQVVLQIRDAPVNVWRIVKA